MTEIISSWDENFLYKCRYVTVKLVHLKTKKFTTSTYNISKSSKQSFERSPYLNYKSAAPNILLKRYVNTRASNELVTGDEHISKIKRNQEPSTHKETSNTLKEKDFSGYNSTIFRWCKPSSLYISVFRHAVGCCRNVSLLVHQGKGSLGKRFKFDQTYTTLLRDSFYRCETMGKPLQGYSSIEVIHKHVMSDRYISFFNLPSSYFKYVSVVL